MNHDILDELARIALEAGAHISDVYDAGATASWRKDDGSPVTQADLRAHEAIAEGLSQRFPGEPIWSEEGAPIDPGVAPARFFLVDPLDGTKEFLSRNGEFTVNIALVENGVAVAGVVYAPALKQLYVAAQGIGAFRRESGGDVRLRTTPLQAGAPLRVTGSRSHADAALGAWLQRLHGPHTFVAAGSSLKFCRLAEGAADVYPRHGPTSQWDTAAGQAILECAGGAVLDAHGQDLRYGPERRVLNPPFLAMAFRGMELPSLL